MTYIIGFFQTCMIISADKSVVPVQLDFSITRALDGHCGTAAPPVLFDIHILQGHIGSLIFCRLHRNGI